MERRSKALMATGIVLWGAGAVVSAVGTAIFVPAATNPCFFVAGSPRGPGPTPPKRAHGGGGERVGTARQALGCGQQSDVDLGMALLTGGIVGSLAGIPLFVVGNWKVPVQPRSEAALVPDLRVGAGHVDLRWAF
jgi:hypothetical protein